MKPVSVPPLMALALLASFCFSVAIINTNGAYSEPALMFVVGGVCTLGFLLAAHLRRLEFAPSTPALATAGVVWVGLFAMVWIQWNDLGIIMYAVKLFDTGRTAQVIFLLGLVSYLPFIVTAWVDPQWLRQVRFAVFAVALVIGAHDVIKTSPAPRIDVWTVQQQGAVFMLQGENPYTHVAMTDTGPRNAEDVPYVYPPTQIYATMPAYWLMQDVRYSMILALVIAGLALRFITRSAGASIPSLLEDAPALFVWLMPKMFFIFEQAWVDPVQLAFICVTVAAHVSKRPMLTAVLLGIWLSAKQTMFWGVGLFALGVGLKPKQWIIAGSVALALVLPFMLWNFGALKHANFDFVSGLPHRPDALTFNNWYMRKTGTAPIPGAVGFVLGALMAGLSAWKLRGSLARFAVGACATYTLFFVFNKWAFANYYFLLAGLAALAAACAVHGEEKKTPTP